MHPANSTPGQRQTERLIPLTGVARRLRCDKAKLAAEINAGRIFCDFTTDTGLKLFRADRLGEISLLMSVRRPRSDRAVIFSLNPTNEFSI